jgi:hypothetical protein
MAQSLTQKPTTGEPSDGELDRGDGGEDAKMAVAYASGNFAVDDPAAPHI